MVSGLIKGARLTAFNPRTFDRPVVSMGFHIELQKSEIEKDNIFNITVAEPYGGIMSSLDENIEPRQSERASNAYLACKMVQKIVINVNLDNLNIISRPASDSLENAAGYFAITTGTDDNALTFTRTISIKDTIYPPSEWPLLRELLLAEMDESNHIIELELK
jgi:hypothetical protein